VRLATLVITAMVAIAPGHSVQAQERPAAASKADAPAAKKDWGDGKSVTDPRDRPAKGSPYAWRQMAFGVAIMLAMLAFVLWLIRRQTRTR
jgi:hypothetical protein